MTCNVTNIKSNLIGLYLGFCCSGYLHAHISYVDDSCQTCLLLLAVDKDLFHKLSECKDKIKEVLDFVIWLICVCADWDWDLDLSTNLGQT